MWTVISPHRDRASISDALRGARGGGDGHADLLKPPVGPVVLPAVAGVVQGEEQVHIRKEYHTAVAGKVYDAHLFLVILKKHLVSIMTQL